eukprot:957312-Ditylum_brightwellii.AAC.1
MHASCMLNDCVVCAFHRIGCGHMYMEQVAAWLDHPRKKMGHYWKKTETVFGEFVTDVAKISIEVVQQTEPAMTLSKMKNVV